MYHSDYVRHENKSRPRRKSKEKSKSAKVAQEMAAEADSNPKVNAYVFNCRINPDVQRRLLIWNGQRERKLTHQHQRKSDEDDFKLKEHVTFQPEVEVQADPTLADSVDSRLLVQDLLYEREHQWLQ